ncbi:MAG: oligosaccharide repeat unit polymerase [Prevotella sp.]|nr:oligosaccharide repeat unit polymerase [Prevotella sp.]
MSIGILVFLGVLVVAFTVLKIGDVFSPWFLTAAIWFAILFLFLFNDILDPLGPQFYTSLSIWVPIFCVSSLLTYYALPASAKREEKATSIDINKTIFNVLFYLSLVMTPFYLYRIMQTIMLFDTSDMLYNLRLMAIYGDENYGILNYTYVINMSLLAVAIWHYPKIPLWKLLAIYFVCSISAFAIMEKGMIFFFLAATVFVLYEKKVIRVRTIALGAIAVVVLFYLITSAREQADTADEYKLTFLDFFAMYILSPAVAYERIGEDLSGQFGSNSFYTIYLFLNRFGGDFEVHTKLQNFVWVPIPTNVYTIFQPFFQDFGQKGVAFFAFFYGTLSGWAYRMFHNGSAFGKSAYIYIAYVLMLQFFQDNLILSTVLVLQFFFFVWLMTQDKIHIYTFKK